MLLGDLDSYMQNNESRPPTYTPYTKINWRWIKDLNISHDTIKVLEEEMHRKISDIPCSNIFTNMFPRASDIKDRINKWDFIKIKSFCMAKQNSIKIKKNQPYGKTYLPMIPQKRVWSLKYIKKSQDSTPGRQTTQLKDGRRTWTDTSPRRTYRWLIDIWKNAHHH